MHLTTAQCASVGACIYWQTLLTIKKIFSLIKVKYWRAPIIFWKYIGSENKQSDTLANFDVEIGVSIGLQEDIHAHERCQEYAYLVIAWYP